MIHMMYKSLIIIKGIKSMNPRIETPLIGEILSEEFMNPLNISAYRLAQEIHVPVSRIQDILHNRRKISADTSIRLARFFGVSDSYFLNIQTDIDLRELRLTMDDEITNIRPFVQQESKESIYM